MERRELFKQSMLAALGTGLTALTSGKAMAQDDKKAYVAQPDILKGQVTAELNPKDAHAYAVGIQAFEYGFPLVYFAN